MKDYTATLKDGSQIFIAQWSASVAFINLGKVCNAFGSGRVEAIAKLSQVDVLASLMDTQTPEECENILKHFVSTVSIDSQRIQPNNYNDIFAEDFAKATEVFMHVVHAVYNDFFVSGLAEVVSQAN